MKTVDPGILIRISRPFSYALSGIAVFVLGASSLAAQTPGQVEFFEKKVRPVLAHNCKGLP